MNNASTTARAAHWSQVECDLIELGATNGLGWAVHMPVGRIQTGETRDTKAAAAADLESLPDAANYSVMEVLAAPPESPAAAMERICKKQASDFRKFCMGELA